MSTLAVPAAVSSPADAGWRRHSLLRILLGLLAAVLPVAATLILAHQFVDKSMRWLWPQLLAAGLCLGGYWLYVRKVERRRADELSGAGAGRELGAGLLLGAGMLAAVIGILAAAGAYHVTGRNGWGVLASPFAEMVLVALVEEIVFRCILQRNLERALGSWAAIWISSCLFALAHLPNDHVTVAAVGNTFVAGLLFAALYLATRRLWLAAATHFAWNFASDAIFSTTTSGHAGKGILAGHTSGPDWLSGGAYGVEGSMVTLTVMALVVVALLRLAQRRGALLDRAAARGRQA